MRRLFVIAAALGLMWALQTVHSSEQGNAGMALAAIGFVVLASFTVGDLLSGLGLPRITGYIVSGILLGPEVIGTLSQPVVAKMGVFNTLALGLIALSAGLEIEIGAMRRAMRTMLAMIAAKVVLLAIIVGGGLYLVHHFVLSLPVPDEPSALLLIAIITCLGIGTSPSITLAMVNDTKARGRLTDITLGLAVLKDVVVIVALAVTIGLGRDAIAPGQGSGIGPAVVHLAQHLGFSIALGSGVGVLLILYVKYVHRELLLGAVVAVLMTAEISAYFELELLLVLIAAGFVVRNASEQEHHLMPALQRISLPVFVVFFTTAGAKVDLGATTSVLPFAGGAAVGRALVYYLSARFGVWVGREGSAVRKNAWFGLLPQAGVTLGLTLMASHEVPELREQILRIGLAVVAINLLFGPVLLGIALARAGEIPGRARIATPMPIAVPTEAIAKAEGAAVAARDLPPLSDPRLEQARAQLARDLDAWATRLVDEVVLPLADRGKQAIARLVSEHKQHENTAVAVRSMLESAAADPSNGLEAQLRAAHDDARRVAEVLPTRLRVVVERRLLRLKIRDGLFTILSKLGRRIALMVGLQPKRRVPVRLAARAASEERLANAFTTIVQSWFEARGDMLRELAKLVNREGDVESVTQGLVRRATQFSDGAAATVRAAVADVVATFHDHLATLGGPSYPPSRLRLYRQEERVAATLTSLDRVAGRGREVMRAQMTTLHADAINAYVSASLDDELTGMVSLPLKTVAQEIIPIIHQIMEHLPANEAWADVRTGGDPLAVLGHVLEQAHDERAASHMRGLQMKYYHATQESKLLARLASRLEGIPARLVVVDRNAAVPGTLLTLEPARRVEEALLEDFSPGLISAIRPLGDLISSLDARVNQALSVATRGVATARAESDGARSRIEAARESVSRARRLLEGLLEEITATGDAANEAAVEVVEETRMRVAAALGKAPHGPARPHEKRRGQRWWSPLVGRVSRRLSRMRQRVESYVRGVLRRPELRDWIIRSSDERLDAVAMRDYVARRLPQPDAIGIPEIYAELVSPAPIDDIRLATARRAELDTLVEVLQPGTREDFTTVLVFGDRGSGRTTLVNLLGHRLARRRVTRLDARYHTRAGGPLAAMAAELNVNADPVELASALRKAPSIILLDDLERFLRSSPAGIDDLDRFLRLVRSTASFTHWVVTAQTATVALLDPFVHLSETFGRRVHLAPVGPEEIDHMLRTRIQFSGLDIRCSDGSRRLRLRPKEAHRRYVRALTSLSGGNLRRAMLLHGRSIVKDGNGFIARRPRAPGLPFLRHLGEEPLAALSLITRGIEVSVDDLAEGLGVAPPDVDRFVLPLHDAGLVESSHGRSRFAVPAHLTDAVCMSLADLGLRPRESR